jgi:hypothetical protein
LLIWDFSRFWIGDKARIDSPALFTYFETVINGKQE